MSGKQEIEGSMRRNENALVAYATTRADQPYPPCPERLFLVEIGAAVGIHGTRAAGAPETLGRPRRSCRSNSRCATCSTPRPISSSMR